MQGTICKWIDDKGTKVASPTEQHIHNSSAYAAMLDRRHKMAKGHTAALESTADLDAACAALRARGIKIVNARYRLKGTFDDIAA